MVVKPAGTPVALAVWHHSVMRTVIIVGKAWPHITAERGTVLASAASVARAEAEGLGLHLAPLGGGTAAAAGSGVLVDHVTPGSQAENVGLKAGDVIEQVDNRPAGAPAEVMERLKRRNAARGDFVALLVHGKASTRWVTLYVGRIDVADLVAPVTRPDHGRTIGTAGAVKR